jgi:hypothetical protein
MNGRVFRLDIPEHQAVQELLPWYASAQLSADETRRVHEHLQSCAQCRLELEWEHGMHAVAAASADRLPHAVDMEGALARLLPALGPQERTAATMTGDGVAPAVATSAVTADAVAAATIAAHGPDTGATSAHRVSWWRAAAANQPSWLRWAVAAQWLAIIGLGTLLLRPDADPAAYRTLGAGAAAMGNLVVVFQPNTSERELRRILQAQNARVVDGPTVTDAYLLNVPAAGRDQALHALRAESAVKLVEPLDGGSAP